MIGPLTIFDKSFIESINSALVKEVSLYFSPVCPPTVVSEIISDLKHPRPRGGRLPEDLVRAIANKMSLAHGPQPASLATLVVGNLVGRPVPMNGRVPIDTTAPDVRVNRDGTGVMIDGTVQQEMWARWGRGEFTTDDEITSSAWRKGFEEADLTVIRDEWRPFAEQLGNPKSLEAVTGAVNIFMSDPRAVVQRE